MHRDIQHELAVSITPLDCQRPAGRTLSPQHARIVVLVAARKHDKEIASELNISRSTLRTHFARLFRYYGVRDRFGLALRLSADTLDPPEQVSPK